jgi:Flp pilus assembly protein TadG
MHLKSLSTEGDVEETDAADDAGSAVLEFILVGLLLLVPLVYLIITLGLIQGQSLGIEAGSRHIARAVATSADLAEARDRTDRVLAAVAADYEIDAARVDMTMTCVPAGAACPSAGVTVVVTVRTDVTLPLMPPVLGLDQIARVPIEASSVQKVSRFWGEEP